MILEIILFPVRLLCRHEWFIGARRGNFVKIGGKMTIQANEQCVLCKKCGKTIYAEIKSSLNIGSGKK